LSLLNLLQFFKPTLKSFIEIDITYVAMGMKCSCIYSCESWTPATPQSVTNCHIARNQVQSSSCSRCWQKQQTMSRKA